MRARQEDSGETQEGGAARASSWEPGTCLPWVESSKRGMTPGVVFQLLLVTAVSFGVVPRWTFFI